MSSRQYGITFDCIIRLVPKVSGQSLGAYIDEHIFSPLGMDDTSYALSLDMGEPRVENHQRQEDGSLDVVAFTSQEKPMREYGCGGRYSTVPGYLRFIRMGGVNALRQEF